MHLLSSYSKYKLHKKTHLQPNDVPYPSVSILKPLMGVDPNLVSNLETFFTMTYPTVSTIFFFVFFICRFIKINKIK